MREIKFRAWDKDEKEMIYGINECLMYWGDTLKNGADRLLNMQSHIPVMQYTGLRDKNGKEIYEGDVVEIKEEGEPYWRGDVYWGRYEWSGRNFDMAHYDDPSDLFGQGLKYIEIIGNIHENPELLEEK